MATTGRPAAAFVVLVDNVLEAGVTGGLVVTTTGLPAGVDEVVATKVFLVSELVLVEDVDSSGLDCEAEELVPATDLLVVEAGGWTTLVLYAGLAAAAVELEDKGAAVAGAELLVTARLDVVSADVPEL